MPIYDFNGTTKQEIGKIYDFNGTASSQIGKVYDNNGSANSLIYSSGVIFPGTAPTLIHSGSVWHTYTGTADTWYWYISNGTNRNGDVGYIMLDLTDATTLHIEGTSSSSRSGWYLVSQSQFNSYKSKLQYPYYVFYQPDSSIYTKKGTSYPVDISVSSYTGTWYLCAGAYTNSNGNVSGSITKIELS